MSHHWRSQVGRADVIQAQAITTLSTSAAGSSAPPWRSRPCWCSGIFIFDVIGLRQGWACSKARWML